MGLDNRKDNLRICTFADNTHNRRSLPKNTSGYRGVYKHINSPHRWYARIKFNHKYIYLGGYSTKEEAADVYAKANKKYFGEFNGILSPVQNLVAGKSVSR